MNNRDYKLYDLLSNGLGGLQYQGFVDTYLADTQNKLDVPGFSFDPDMQMDFTFSYVEATLGMATMATYVDPYSPAPVKSQTGFSTQTGNIPRMKHGFAIDEKIMREELVFMQRTKSFSSNMAFRMRDILFDNTEKLILGNYNSLTYQRHQVMSKGEFETTASNNPDGIKTVKFSARIPSSNVTTLTSTARWFTDANNTEGSASDPIKNLMDMIDSMENLGVLNYHFEVDKKSLQRAFNHSKIKSAISLNLYPLADSANVAGLVANLSLDAKKAALEAVLGCPITVINSVVATESFSKTAGKTVQTQMRSFAPDTWILVPDGSLGVIKTVEPIQLGSPSMRVATYDGGRTLLKQWYNDENGVQYIESEHTSLVVPDKPKYIFRLVNA